MAEGNVTKKKLAEALQKLTIEKDYEKISVQEISQAADLNRQTFYYHFKDKAALLCWTYMETGLYALTENLSLDNWEEAVLEMLKQIKENSDFYQKTVMEDPDVLMNQFIQLTQTLFIRLFDEVDQEKLLSGTDKRFYARFLSYGCGGILIDWIKEDYPEPPITIAAQLFRFAKDIEFFASRLYEKE